VDDDPRYYMDYTGTGNSLNVRHPHVLQLIMDSLRYWITEMHVDGFRFDLASTLARELHDVDRLSAFFDIIQQDPVISQTKLIAEPWDVGEGGYQVGNFPPLWTEWNGKYRDTMRDYWRGESAVGEMASRLSGSSDLYAHNGRRPYASINFVTAHDGFTLRDLVSYNDKHNEANLDDNSGEDHNRSWNHGVEGPTDDPEINALRAASSATSSRRCCCQPGRADAARRRRVRPHPAGQQQHLLPGQRAHLVRLGLDAEQQALLAFTRRLIRCAAPTRCSGASSSSGGTRRGGHADLVWLQPDGTAMTEEDWDDPHLQALMFFLNGRAIPTRDERGRPIATTASSCCQRQPRGRDLHPPRGSYGKEWEIVLDTAEPTPGGARRRFDLAPGDARRPSRASRWSCCAAWTTPVTSEAPQSARPTACSSPRTGLRRGRRARRLPRRPRGQPPVPVAGADGARGLDARLRRRRPVDGLGGPRRRGRLRALAERAHAAGLGLVGDIVPNHVGHGSGEPAVDRLLAEGQAGSYRGLLRRRLGPAAARRRRQGGRAGARRALRHGAARTASSRSSTGGAAPELRYHEHRFPLSRLVDRGPRAQRRGGGRPR
jgi:pullulanase/glycogen debranching enzyme